MMDVHKKKPIVLGANNCQNLKKKVHISIYGKKVIPSYTKAWLKEVGAPSTWKTYSSKMSLLKIQNLEHKYGATKT